MIQSTIMGKEMYCLAETLFPICRSITGDGVRQTLKMLSDFIAQDGMEFSIHEVPVGTQVFDWTIPKEWAIREAYIETEQGERIIDMKQNNLHVMGYSIPVDQWVTLEELKQYVYTQPDQPDVIPYVTSYYKERFGFCMSETHLRSLPEGRYHMVIESELFDGSLTYADLILSGESDREIMITSYICHPSMANNECSGPVLLAALARYVHLLPKRRYTYRFVLNPETIGAITYLSKNYQHLKEKIEAGIVLSCVGDDRAYSIIHSRYGDTITDKSMMNILRGRENVKEYSFLKRGSDERQYNAPGIDLPVIGFCRSKYGEYPEYHTSADNLGLISPSGLQGSYDVMTEWIQAMEQNGQFKVAVLCEPQLGKRGLYPTISQKGGYDEVRAMTDFIAYADGTNDLFDISDRIGVSVRRLASIAKSLEEGNLLERVEYEESEV